MTVKASKNRERRERERSCNQLDGECVNPQWRSSMASVRGFTRGEKKNIYIHRLRDTKMSSRKLVYPILIQLIIIITVTVLFKEISVKMDLEYDYLIKK